MTRISSFLRNHAEALAGVVVALIVTCGLSLSPGCARTASIVTPGKTVDAAELQQEITTQQQVIQTQPTSAPALADLTAKAAAAQQDLSAKQASINGVVNTLGGIALAVAHGGHVDPSTLVSAGITLVTALGGIGALAGSITKQGVIADLRTTQAPVAGGAS